MTHLCYFQLLSLCVYVYVCMCTCVCMCVCLYYVLMLYKSLLKSHHTYSLLLGVAFRVSE